MHFKVWYTTLIPRAIFFHNSLQSTNSIKRKPTKQRRPSDFLVISPRSFDRIRCFPWETSRPSRTLYTEKNMSKSASAWNWHREILRPFLCVIVQLSVWCTVQSTLSTYVRLENLQLKIRTHASTSKICNCWTLTVKMYRRWNIKDLDLQIYPHIVQLITQLKCASQKEMTSTVTLLNNFIVLFLFQKRKVLTKESKENEIYWH